MTGKRNIPTRLAALQEENQELLRRLEEAEETLRAIGKVRWMPSW